MKSQKAIQLFFFLLIVLVPLGYSAAVQESALLPKNLLLNFLLLISLGVFFKNLGKFAVNISLSSVLLLAYLFLAFLSAWGATNFSDALFSSSKILLFALTFFVSSFLIKDATEKSLKAISLFSKIAIVLAVLFLLKELGLALQSREPFSSTVYLVSGLHGHKNLLSAWLMLLLPLALIGYVSTNKSKKIGQIMLPVLALMVILLLQARASYTGLAIGLLVFSYLYYAVKRKNAQILMSSLLYFVFGIAALIILLILFSPVIENFLSSTSLDSTSANERLVLWKKTIGLIKENSFWGIGGENWKYLFPTQGLDGLYRAELNNVAYVRPHNDLLWIWAEHGLLGLLTYLGFMFTLLLKGIKNINEKEDGWKISAIAIAGVFAYLAMSIFDFPKERVEHQVALAILLAIIVSKSKNQPLIQLNPKLGKVIVLMIFVCTGLAGYFAMQRYTAETHIKNILISKEKGESKQIVEQAEIINQGVIQADNNAVPIAWYKGNALYNLGRQKEAAESLIEAVEINPYSFNVLNNAGVAYILKNEQATAEEYFLAALKINPKHDDSRLNLAAAYINQAKWELAKQALNEVHATSQRSEDLRRMIGDR